MAEFVINQHQTIKDKIERLNKVFPLSEKLVPLLGDKREVKIADIGSGPLSTIGQQLEGVDVTVYRCDKQDFSDFWKQYNSAPLFPVEYQDMEKLNYPDDFFDIVYCENALDHTANALAAVQEMIRVCKPGGWVYIECNLDQMSTGHKHFWNARENGVFTNNQTYFDLKDLGFDIEYINIGGERRYNRIIATLEKK